VAGHQVVTKVQMQEYFFDKRGKNFFQRIAFVQTCIKMPQFGIGKPLYYEFFAPINEKDDKSAREEITYDFKSMPDEVTLLENGR
jgi:hypothetical protein